MTKTIKANPSTMKSGLTNQNPKATHPKPMNKNKALNTLQPQRSVFPTISKVPKSGLTKRTKSGLTALFVETPLSIVRVLNRKSRRVIKIMVFAGKKR